MDRYNTMLVTAPAPNISRTYIFRSFGSGWSLQQRLVPWSAQEYTIVTSVNSSTNVTTTSTSIYQVKNPYKTTDKFLAYEAGTPLGRIEYDLKRTFGQPALWGGYIMHNAGPHGKHNCQTNAFIYKIIKTVVVLVLAGAVVAVAVCVIGGVQIRSQFRNNSCLLLWMSDHYLDGWDTAVLTVRAPDTTNDTFHPHCDQVSTELLEAETRIEHQWEY